MESVNGTSSQYRPPSERSTRALAAKLQGGTRSAGSGRHTDHVCDGTTCCGRWMDELQFIQQRVVGHSAFVPRWRGA